MTSTHFRCPPYYGCSISSQWLEEIVSSKIAEIATDAPVLPDSGCLLNDMGDFLVQASAALARLAESVLHGPHIDIYMKKKMKEMGQEHDFSELNTLDYIHDKHSSLKAISTSLAHAAALTASTWAPNSEVPRPGENPNKYSPQESVSDSHIPPSSRLEHASHHETAEDEHSTEDSPNSTTLKQYAVDHLLSSLAARGKGRYECPLREDCKKGGVSLEGKLIIFERNSSFRAHLQKHEKIYKCDIPGCKNKNGFARIDQLKRHQQAVGHRQ